MPMKILTATLAALALLAPTSAIAAYPGTNGKIAFVRGSNGSGDIYTINPDGTGEQNVTKTNNDYEERPAISPNGRRLAWSIGDGSRVDAHIFTANLNGKKAKAVTAEHRKKYLSTGDPTWSPNGKQLAFMCYVRKTLTTEVCRVSANGEQWKQLTQCDCASFWGVEWSTRNQILFQGEGGGLFSVGADGGSVGVMVDPAVNAFAYSASWHPSGEFFSYSNDYGDLAVRGAAGGNDQVIWDAPAEGRSFVSHAAYSPDGTRLVAEGNAYGITIIDPATRDEVEIVNGTISDNYNPNWGPAPK
jgi:Tol biopolymer transport system component